MEPEPSDEELDEVLEEIERAEQEDLMSYYYDCYEEFAEAATYDDEWFPDSEA